MPRVSPQERFAELLERHRKIVFKVANLYGRRAEDRRDLEQEIRLQAWKAFPRYDETRAFSTWMYRIALNVAISFVRSAGRRERHSVSLEANAAEPIDDRPFEREQDERVKTLYRVIDRLGELDRALLLLYLEERSYRDIAEILGMTETNVATKISRLKQRIRKDFTEPNLG